MPTPSSNPPAEVPQRSHSSTCPEEIRSSINWRSGQDGSEMSLDQESSLEPVGAPHTDEMIEDVTESRSTTESPRPDSRSGATPSSSATTADHDSPGDTSDSHSKPMETDDEVMGSRDRDHMQVAATGEAVASSAAKRQSASYDIVSPVSVDGDRLEDGLMQGSVQGDLYAPSMGYEYSNIRITPSTPSSFLRPGSKFHGTQQSERQVYDVQVEIKYVDLRESFLCGYLKIQGLTEDNPTLTTYFEGEIIGSKYGFITKHEGWGATDKIDLNHWSKFTAFRQYKPQVRKGGHVAIPNLANRDNIFMRWKEHFLVPDHRVRTINGASFEGFYYICFNQKQGDVSGIYFHSRSEKFQQLELKHVDDRGCFGAIEFR